ncbi:ADR108Cp [Eremothecium gossypii ATCC 10895]|uniref:ADR108Cp n=1 Tax=Eremothecium gossypii (strain ATCC 10895 / CBS 109.51 / FGSC 9923 / NRRL Y-1056) TaxID=284811 RepID=Q75A19_EREGS|nr:ADR108Cp [Eremothecium gossypii ATCC 10895]AAS52028.1 ADR108Cp [Eremothecium gossypii ATCC 10895]AEY96327.1 FADR108Cp [Eremothecium gossypii FDAG1]
MSDVVRLGGLHEGPVLACDSAPDGRTVVTCGLDQRIGVWDLDGEAPYILETGDVASCVRWLGGQKLAIGCADGHVCIYDLTTGERLRKLAHHTRVVNQLAGGQNGNFVSVGDDGRLNWWDERAASGRPAAFVATDFPLLSAAVCPVSAGRVYTSGIEPVVRAYEQRRSEDAVWKTQTGHRSGVTSLCTSAHGEEVCALGFDDSVSFYGQQAGQRLRRGFALPARNTGRLLARCAFVEDKRYVAAYGYVVDVTSEVVVSDELASLHAGAVIDTVYKEGSRQLLSTSADGTALVKTWEAGG